ncbi:MAG TPA: outer membrane protein assembly factor BamE [Casimicrobiaceae bacterium]|nr:outer membrane protein assembly factor BamE [Casimicrobiaceae bacterium]
MRAVLCAVGIALATCGCSWQTLGVYKLDINQGNYVTQDQVDRLKVGLSRQQVKTVLGTPLLADPFHANRWDYVYIFERQAKVLEQRRLAVYFVDDRVARWEGDEMPPPPSEVARAGGGDAMMDKSLSTAPKTGEENWLLQLLKKLGWWD